MASVPVSTPTSTPSSDPLGGGGGGGTSLGAGSMGALFSAGRNRGRENDRERRKRRTPGSTVSAMDLDLFGKGVRDLRPDPGPLRRTMPQTVSRGIEDYRRVRQRSPGLGGPSGLETITSLMAIGIGDY